MKNCSVDIVIDANLLLNSRSPLIDLDRLQTKGPGDSRLG
jgi:hypothetical protein